MSTNVPHNEMSLDFWIESDVASKLFHWVTSLRFHDYVYAVTACYGYFVYVIILGLPSDRFVWSNAQDFGINQWCFY